MLADSGVPPLRGTAGLWKQYPHLRKQGVTFEKIWNDNTFRESPQLFWYFFGSLYNQYQEAEPHQGYTDLLEILRYLKGEDGWFIFHEGTDILYERAGFPMNRVMQGKGSLFHWQCKPC
jgi:NAD-dependent SIR2 family protein deacetylase